MLAELRLSRLGVIDEASLAFGPGFTVISGETGAGKTMIVTGLGLLLGAKADARLIRHGEQRARVESRWLADPELAEQVAEFGGEIEDGEVLVSRVLTPNRSSAFVGGAQVPAKTAAELLAEVATIHGQSEQQRLGTPERQRAVLDRFAGIELAELLAKYRELFERRRAAVAEVTQLRAAEQERARELELCLFGLDEIAQVTPEPDEDLVLAAEARRLLAVEDLRLAAGAAAAALGGDEEPGAYDLVVQARRALSRAEGDDPALAGLAAQAQDLEYGLSELSSAVSSYLAGLDSDPVRLEWIAGRQADLQRLTRKYGATIAEVLAFEQQTVARVAELRGSDDRITVLDGEIEVWTAQLVTWAQELRELRLAAAERLTDLVAEELAALAMPKARLVFAVTEAELGPWGADSVALLFAANSGSPLAPLAKVASGGELSRVRLALEVVLADGAAGTFVFDEVDSGIGGAVALEVGSRLARLATQAQVIVVTHLAQVAAFADRHFVVQKSDDGQVTRGDVAEVSGPDRATELARMMGGLDTAASLRHAEELLELATSR